MVSPVTSSSRRNFLKAGVVTAASLPFLKVLPVSAASKDVLVVTTGQTINSLDLHRTGTNRPSYQVAVNCYDRLVTFGTRTTDDGGFAYDSTVIEPELAESWSISEDGLTMTFTLKDAVFQDGSPVTAADVKWSFDRAVSVGGFPTVQMKAGGLVKPEQFTAVDDKTFTITLDKPSKLALPDLAVPVPFIINSKVAIANATDDDPWAMEYLHKNTIGSGAFKVIKWAPGEQLVYERHDAWVGGPMPEVKRVVIREVPSQATRRALVERGDVNLSFNIPNKDAKELSDNVEDVSVWSTPIDNCIHCVGLNTKFEPFQDPDVRKAVAWSIPYEEIFQTAAYGKGAPMWGGAAKPETAAWPQQSPYSTDMDKALASLEASAFPKGFSVPFSISLGSADWMEPTALLIQENLAKIGITSEIEKIPGASWRTAALVEKRLDLHLENFGGWLNYPCYYFFWAYKEGHLFNSSNYRNDEVEQLIDETLHMAVEDPAYEGKMKRLFEIAFEDLPRIPLWQPALNVAGNGAEGYEFWFHRQLDIRGLKLT